MDPSSLTSHPSTAAQAKTVSLCDVYVCETLLTSLLVRRTWISVLPQQRRLDPADVREERAA